MTSDKKIALIFNGVPPDDMNVNAMAERILNHIPHDKVVFHSWTEYKDKFKDFKYEVLFTPEPKVTYHPYRPEEKVVEVTKHHKRHFQILGFAHAIDSLDEEFDYYIRVRYDTYINNPLTRNIIDVIMKQYKCETVGFGAVPVTMTPKQFEVALQNLTVPLDYHWAVEENKLRDFLIITKSVDIKKIFQLYDEKKLLPAEDGWWQVLHKEKTRNILSWVTLWRHVTTFG